MDTQKKLQLTEFIRICNQADEICHNYAKAHGLSGTAFYILYSLVDSNMPLTQRELCRKWAYPRQTVNSALKTLKKQGVIELRFSPDNQKSKEIHLTEKGLHIAEEIIAPFIKADSSAFASLSQEECTVLLAALQKYNSNLTLGLKSMPIRSPAERIHTN